MHINSFSRDIRAKNAETIKQENADLRKRLAAAQAAAKAQRARAEKWKGETQITTDYKVSRESMLKIADELISGYGTKTNRAVLANHLENLANSILSRYSTMNFDDIESGTVR